MQDYNQGNFAQAAYFPYAIGSALSDASMDVFFSPNRQIPSPIIIGTIPSSTRTGWQTLAFSPNPAIGAANHPGTKGIPASGLLKAQHPVPDHVLLDLFWMPVCEPYPISDQFSTAGKVNLNYQMMPFTYIQRRTALHAAMKATWMYGITIRRSNIDGVPFQSSFLLGYKNPYLMRGTKADNGKSNAGYVSRFALDDFTNINSRFGKTRYAINIPETMEYFDRTVFDRGDIFRSASQLCETFLVPSAGRSDLDIGLTAQTVADDLWAADGTLEGFRVTPTNGRQDPYNHIYSRITTKSNSYTVHWRVQSVRKIPGPNNPADVWDENRDRVVAEARGSTLIERYIDPNAKNIPDYAAIDSGGNPIMDLADIAKDPLSNYYRWRIVANTRFNP